LELEGPGLPPIIRIEDTARRLVDEMRAIQPQGPYFIGGFCRAAFIAFEMAQQLVDHGQKVGLLVFFDAPPLWPPQARPGPGRRAISVVGKAAAYFCKRAKGGPAGLTTELIGKGKGYANQLIRPLRLRATAVLNGQVGHELQLKQALGRYRPRVYPGPIKLIIPTERSTDPDLDPYSGPWNLWAGEGLEICEVPGDHMTMFSYPNIEILSEKLISYIEQGEGQYR